MYITHSVVQVFNITLHFRGRGGGGLYDMKINDKGDCRTAPATLGLLIKD